MRMGAALLDARCITLCAGSARPREVAVNADSLASSSLSRRASLRSSPARSSLPCSWCTRLRKQDVSWRVAATGAPERPASGAPPAGNMGQLPSPSSTPPLPAGPPPPPTFDEIMAFDGAPETINGRLAMLGIVWGAVMELTQGVSFWDQIQDPSQYGLFYAGLTMAAVTVASLPPLLSAKRAAAPRFLFFTEEAEKANGRAAMLGIVGVFSLEYIINLIAKLL